MSIIDRKALNHCCLSYISRACNNIEMFRLLSDDDKDEQRNTFRAKLTNKIEFELFVFPLFEFLPNFDPANVLEKLPDDNSGILTPSSISSIRNNSIGIG